MPVMVYDIWLWCHNWHDISVLHNILLYINTEYKKRELHHEIKEANLKIRLDIKWKIKYKCYINMLYIININTVLNYLGKFLCLAFLNASFGTLITLLSHYFISLLIDNFSSICPLLVLILSLRITKGCHHFFESSISGERHLRQQKNKLVYLIQLPYLKSKQKSVAPKMQR